MIDIRPVANTIGKLVITLGAAMVLPMCVDYWAGDPHWKSFLEAAILTMLAGGLITLATHDKNPAMTLEQAFLLTASIWAVLPAAGAVPFMVGEPHASFTDAYFEAMSGLTTTGATAFPDLDNLPKGINLWRGFLNWSGGLGIIVVAMIFLPVMKVGGMQFFKSEGFDTLGKILPRAFDIAREMTWVYIALTAICAIVYILLGMNGFDAVVMAMSTCSTGGFSNYDASFGPYVGPLEYAAAVFMILASIPFIRMVQLVRGSAQPLWQDVQIRAYLRWTFYAIAAIVIYRLLWLEAKHPEAIIRETVFNVVSTFSGTGLASTDVTQWGHFPFAVLVVIGLIGGCTGSTACSVKVFRYLVLFQAVKSQLKRMQSPHRVYPLLYDGRPLDRDVVDSVMTFFTLFMLTFGLLIMGLAMTGLHPRTALTGAWTSIANVGVLWGPELSPNGAVDQLPTAAKWMMTVGMYIGRLELMTVLVLFLPRFWRS
ncbi:MULTISPECIES: TrkH family potassium uptake protein [Paracoccus]|uniref:Trk system potassium uptake protein n=1 Tax=Paracoccus litorisediminis TaxID=2006130 RepID=A0A844HJ84_9RHOB|nr:MULTISPECIES: TrkH family potassium uptake protein [Paracoccus]MBD9525966.1 TrkH family potassium uptake protein [Paracoccus sp. PAR01]MTH58417.1 potassium transporter TrkH [Paracoccus litorisediminis]